ncbi:MAG: UDP-glucose 4-epimerase [Thermoproteota archaeon]|nr:MAG: UDP-glucose 4-epimerase [Candidatus Korarchaeota archaeon]
MSILVTGGAGFIGSYLVEELVRRGYAVRILDNLSTGRVENLREVPEGSYELYVGDLLDPYDVREALEGCSTVYHFAANPEVRVGYQRPQLDFEENILATKVLLEEARRQGIELLVFASSSTVYGEPTQIPTPESYGPLKPISSYGASKLACEAMISAYSHYYGFKAVILRLANIIGGRSRHGVIYDFIMKLKRDPRRLEVLGDGTQRKSYLHVSDCVSAVLAAAEHCSEGVEVYNVGSRDWVSVLEIARIVIEEMELSDVRIELTGGVMGGRGWPGDVKLMLLSTEKLESLGWKPRLSSREAVREACRELLGEL